MRSSKQPKFDKAVKRRRPAPPLNKARLEEMALGYVARFSTSAAKLERYLARKLRERGWDEEEGGDDGGRPDPGAIAARYVDMGYIDDEAYARARSSSLLRRGYGARRVEQTLWQDGIEENLRSDMTPGEAAARHAALRMAQKRRFGPFGAKSADHAADGAAHEKQREKQIAAMLRAGHSLDMARQMVNAASERAALEWAREYDNEERHDPLD